MKGGRERSRVPLHHPAWWLAGLAAIASVLLSVSFVIYEKDFWQHLAVGRAIWQLHAVPVTQVWTWPTYGAPNVTPSWGFRALLWPLWQAGGVVGLFAWRWVTTLLVFGLAFLTARRMGAAGMTPLVVIAVCALTYRQRSQVRPETLASVWLAATIALLEWRRSWSAERLRAAGAWRDPALLLVPLLVAWVNTHLSYALGLAVLGAYLVDTWVARRPGAAGLVRAAALSLLAAFLNPFGWRAVVQPLEYFAGQRDEPIFRIITELTPLDLGMNLKNLLPLVLFGWPLLIVWRAARRRRDWAEIALFAGFVPLSFSAQRFLGFTMAAATPFLARDVDEWVAGRAWPAWTSPAWMRAAACAAACLGSGLAEWGRSDLPLGVKLRLTEYPIAACDFMARQGVAGRGFNQFFLGGYMLYRFWPDRERLPFMDIHQTGARADRDLYAFALADPGAWSELDRRHRFDYALLRRTAYAGDRLVEHLDADSSFALVFVDDAAALWARKTGRLGPLAARFGYHDYPAGVSQLGRLGYLATTDSAARAGIVRQLEREAAGSPYHALALGRLGSLELAIGDLGRAERDLRGALGIDPHAARAHERLGWVALAEGRARDALAEFEAECRANGGFPRYELAIARAYQALGDQTRARRHYQRELDRDPGSAEARDSLAALADRFWGGH
jgi:tetratricopeptide (TPR) repeat protein